MFHPTATPSATKAPDRGHPAHVWGPVQTLCTARPWGRIARCACAVRDCHRSEVCVGQWPHSASVFSICPSIQDIRPVHMHSHEHLTEA